MKSSVPYEKYLVAIAKKNRNNATYSERVLWNYLKCRRMLGFDFDRQKPILSFIVDFFCEELMLAIEVDGFTHLDDDQSAFDREKEIRALGIKMLRFNAHEVTRNPLEVVRSIENWILENLENKKG